MPEQSRPGGASVEELDEWVRRCSTLETLVRKLSYEVEYEPSVVVWKGQTRRQVAQVSGYDTHGQTALTSEEEAMFRQVLAFPPLSYQTFPPLPDPNTEQEA